MITLLCAFIGYLFNAFGFECIKNGDDLMMAFMCEVFVEALSASIYLIVNPICPKSDKQISDVVKQVGNEIKWTPFKSN